MRMINYVKELIGDCVVIFLDDIAVYSDSKEEHEVHLRKVFELLVDNILYPSIVQTEKISPVRTRSQMASVCRGHIQNALLSRKP
jgi:hypothetical protein